MTSPERSAETVLSARRLRRGITATWWYTASGVLMFEVLVLLSWTLLPGVSTETGPVILLIVGALVWLFATLLMLNDYRNRADPDVRVPRLRVWILLGVAVAFGGIVWFVTSSPQLAAVPLAQSLMLLTWPRTIRFRLLLFVVAVLVVLGIIDATQRVSTTPALGTVLVLAAFLPVMTVSSLWWWDVLVVLDRARASEARLAATQERLRVATDVHDLQGHHLQVIALQLELAERLHTQDPDAALAQLQAARLSVTAARQGTRDLATRFRSVPLGDELANARDLLRAAGLSVETDIAPDAHRAPADALGPVIRETTTNVLRHGGGKRARIVLARDPRGWRYEISNDAGNPDDDGGGGSGLEGIERRLADVGGTLQVRHEDDFTLIATVPDGEPA